MNAPDLEGPSPELEATMINSVTGNNYSFEEYMQIGRRIWNLNRCIVALQENIAATMYCLPICILQPGQRRMHPYLVLCHNLFLYTRMVNGHSQR